MDLEQYFARQNHTVSFTEEQASSFAKGVAGDFNPIHDPGSRRFCVPGDLLFCVLLSRYGVGGTTAVQFRGMLDASTQMCLPVSVDGQVHVLDTKDKALLSLFLDGRRFDNPVFVNALSEAYVKFSGRTFPDILVPLMRDARVMINPDRPMVIYKDMIIELDPAATKLNDADVDLRLADTDISVNGRKGAVRLAFDIQMNKRSIGRGEKNMVLSGLRDYDEDAMQGIVDQYNLWRTHYSQPDSQPG